jgi:phosphatidylinositol dimannoside acyltransferase
VTATIGSEAAARDETTRESVAYHVYRSVAWLARTLPERLGRRLFRLGGRAAFELSPATRAVVARNLGPVLGRPPADPIVGSAVRAGFESYARYWFESFRLAEMTPDEVAARFESFGADHLWRALDAGGGAIVALPHVGNWDAAGPWLRSMDRPIVAVAEQLRPPRLFDLFVEHRAALGVEAIGLGEPGIGRTLASRLAAGSIVALVADRDLTDRGIEVTMFGRPRRLPAGPALLSVTTGAPLLVTPVYQTDGGWRVVMTPPLSIEPTGDRRSDVVALTRRMAAEFERAISAAPTDWHMFQPAWER